MKRTLFTSSFKRVISVIAVVTITLFVVSKISFLLENKTSYKNYASFFTKDEEYDVFLIGSSHVRYGFYPMELWREYGITSYNLAGDANTIPVDYWVLKQALNFHVPKLVVVDTYDSVPNSLIGGWEHVHNSTGAFPLSIDKIRMVRDLTKDPELIDPNYEPTDEKWDLIVKIAEYHERWCLLDPTDFDSYEYYVKQSEIRKGAKPLTDIAAREPKIYPDVIDADYDEKAREYLEKIIELCNDKGCEVLLVNTGYDCNDASKLFADSVPQIAEKYGLEYIDFTSMDLIDWDCDLQTTGENTHLNASGGYKHSMYLGNFICEKYSVADHRDDPSCVKWHSDFDKYNEYLEQTLCGISAMDEYIELLYGMGYDVILDIYEAEILQEGFNSPMLKNLGVDVDKVTSGTQIKVSVGSDIEYGRLNDVDENFRARIVVFDSDNQRVVDEKTF